MLSEYKIYSRKRFKKRKITEGLNMYLLFKNVGTPIKRIKDKSHFKPINIKKKINYPSFDIDKACKICPDISQITFN